jgi:hypothetical protein
MQVIWQITINFKMKFCLTLIFLFITNSLQAEVLKVEKIKFLEKKTNIDFGEPINLPFVTSNLPEIAKKINDYLYIDLVGIPAPNKAADGIVRKLSDVDNDPIAGVSAMQYKVLVNNGKLFSLKTDAEFCGEYCEDYSQSYSFDAATGRYIMLQDIFSEAGIEALKTKLYKARVTTIKLEIKRLQAQLAKPVNKSKKPSDADENAEDAEASIAMYQSCLIENAQIHKDEMKSGDDHELAYFTLNKNHIIFTRSRCSNHASRALDAIDEFHNGYKFQTLKPYFTAYAKNLLLHNHLKNSQATGITGQVFYGNIGESKITLKIHKPEGYDRMLKAVYFYDKYRKPIELSGTGDNWTEINSTDKPQPEITSTWTNGIATGQWRGKDKVLPFKISP